MKILYIVLAVVGGAAVLWFLSTILVSSIIYTILLVRTSKKKWARGCSWDNEEQQRMFDEGAQWEEKNQSFHKTLSVVSDKLRLIGEYYDFGSDKAVIIVPGRMETCTYSCYFAPQYEKSGYNVLTIDNRSHGLSEGRYNCLGLKEWRDIIAWAKLLHEEHGVKTIVLHGICIGAATCMLAVTNDQCLDYIKGLVTDGMYTDFSESLRRHISERNKRLFPVFNEILWYIKLVSGKDVVKNGPLALMKKLDKPILFIYSKMDAYSVPEKARLLFDSCHSDKTLVWFEKGIHSHVRINAPEKYDAAIEKFLNEKIENK